MTVAPDLFARYAGRYTFGPNAVMTVTSADGQLWASLNKFGFFDLRDDRKTQLITLTDSDFYIAGRYKTRLSFVRDQSGEVSGAVIDPGPWQQAGLRNGN